MAFQSYNLKPYGVTLDTNPHDVGEGEYTRAENIRFDNLASTKFGGEEVAQTTAVEPYHLLFNGNHSEPLWYYMGDGSIYKTDILTETDISPVTISQGVRWDASLFNLIPIFNNAVNPPFVSINDAQCIPLPNFPASTTCQAIRPYRSFLIAMNITESANIDPNRLIWSDSSDAGALPASWDIADPSTLAGDAYLTSSRGEIIDGLQMRDVFVIYKNHATYVLRLIGGASVMQIDKVQINTGILAKDCVVELKGSHVILTDNDVVIFDGQSVESIAEKRVKDRIQKTMDQDNFENSFLLRYEQLNEIWVCWPEKGHTYPNVAAVWNWRDDKWSIRDIGISKHMLTGVTSFNAVQVWDDVDVGIKWDDMIGSWNQKSQSTVSDNVLNAGSGNLTYIDDGQNLFGRPMTTLLEKATMDLGPPEYNKLITKIIPRITAKAGVRVFVSLGLQDDPDDEIRWLPEVLYTVGTDREVSVIGRGRFISVRFRTSDLDQTWKLHGWQFKYKMSGRF